MSGSNKNSGVPSDANWEGAAGNAGLMGAKGFKSDYLDSKNNTEDVTHHIGAYLALGASNAYVKNIIASAGDYFTNGGDTRAADVAYMFGGRFI